MSPIDASALSNLMDDVTAMVVVLVSVVAAAWLVAQIIKQRAGKKLAPPEIAMLDQMARIAGRMEDRMAAVERVLDAESPAWRNNSQDAGGRYERQTG